MIYSLYFYKENTFTIHLFYFELLQKHVVEEISLYLSSCAIYPEWTLQKQSLLFSMLITLVKPDWGDVPEIFRHNKIIPIIIMIKSKISMERYDYSIDCIKLPLEEKELVTFSSE